MERKIHRGCGGEVVNRKCLKCGKKWNLVSYGLTGSVESEEVKFSPDSYRKRIRKGKDIYK